MVHTLATIASRLLVTAAALSSTAAAKELPVADAIRAAWSGNPGLAAGAHQVEAARAEAQGAHGGHWPTLAVTAKGVGTSEPVGVFGTKLDEQRITQADFNPATLNSPGPAGGVGLGAAVILPIWMGGRITSGERAADAQAGAEANSQVRRRQEMALAVVEAYFAVQVAAQGVQYADDALEHAREVERFLRQRNQKGLVLDADAARGTAFRAQAEAEREAVLRQLGSARSALAMLTGLDTRRVELVTPVEAAPAAALPGAPGAAGAPASPSPERPDVAAARLRSRAAEESIGVSRASLLPEVFAQAGLDTLRGASAQGATWWSAALVVRWQIGVSSVRNLEAAEARAAAAASAARWQEVQASREVDEARRAGAAAEARVRSAREAVAASESARELRQARYRQGLLPLTEVLDAEAALAGARSLLLNSQLESRIARAQLDLALGLPIEGVES